jgi:hypothetical protein
MGELLKFAPNVRIIFSRKGFDSRYGGGASPILPDGTMVSLPIPEKGSGLRYADIKTPRGTMLALMRELGITRVHETNYEPLSEKTEAHLDPDLYRSARVRHAEWRPVFGQSRAAQGHLSNQGVRAGDLFIFYGSFRRTSVLGDRLQYIGEAFHVIYAYMRVGWVIGINSSTDLAWCSDHPHLVIRTRLNNTLYVAADAFGDSDRPGCAVLSFDQRRVLSKRGALSSWHLPHCFHPDVSGRTLSYHGVAAYSRSNEYVILKTKSPGQEYVVEATDDMIAWVSSVLQ